MKEYDVLFQDMGQRARNAAHILNRLDEKQKNALLKAMQHALVSNIVKILDANEYDMAQAQQAGLSPAMLDRLQLSGARIEAIARDIDQVIDLPDPVGQVLEDYVRPNGLHIKKVTVPIGVTLMIYEARPNVTVDATVLSLKAGNAVILRGGKEAFRTNKVLVDLLRRAAESQGITGDIVQMVPITDRDAVTSLLQQKRYIDVVIPRGSAALIQRVVTESAIPVIETGSGICHVYVDESADFTKALPILRNGKCQRPSVCNAVETLLVHEAIALDFLKEAIPMLANEGVEIRLGGKGMEVARKLNMLDRVTQATEADWATEYNDMIISVKVVSNLDDALDHIAEYGTKHSECIVTENEALAHRFMQEVDAACVYVNSSTRFTDGHQFGFGAEIGISTQKLHARGPMGLREITSYKYLVFGEGHVRE